MNNNWLNNNIAPIIAIVYTLFSLTIYLLVLIHVISATENIAFLIINSITNIMMIIVGYFFGSSIGSKQKQVKLDERIEKVE